MPQLLRMPGIDSVNRYGLLKFELQATDLRSNLRGTAIVEAIAVLIVEVSNPSFITGMFYSEGLTANSALAVQSTLGQSQLLTGPARTRGSSTSRVRNSNMVPESWLVICIARCRKEGE